MLVGHGCEAAGFPVLLCLFDTLLARGDKIPPYVTRSFERVAAEEHHTRRLCRAYRDAVAGTKNQQLRRFVSVARDLDLAVNNIDSALFVVRVERHAHAGLE